LEFDKVLFSTIHLNTVACKNVSLCWAHPDNTQLCLYTHLAREKVSSIYQTMWGSYTGTAWRVISKTWSQSYSPHHGLVNYWLWWFGW